MRKLEKTVPALTLEAVRVSYLLFLSHLPEVETDSTEIVISVDGIIGGVFWVVDFWMHPLSFVGRVLDVLWLPLALGGVRQEG